MPSPLIVQAVRQHLRGPVCTAASLLAVTAVAQAQGQGLTRTVTVDIAPQKVSTALLELSRQAEIQVLVPGLIGDARATRGVRGRMSVGEALTRLLEGTSLKYRLTGENIVGIEAVDAEGRPVQSGSLSQEDADRLRWADGSFHLAQTAASGTDPQATTAPEGATDGQPLDEVVVTSKILFRENDAFGATKMGLSLKDTPQTVTVVTADMIDFAGIRTFNDFYKLDASGGTAHTFDGFPRNYYRGFRQQGSNAIRVDGFRMPGNIDLDLALFDRFEVIKGPTSTLYGQNSIGGTLNAVSKLPQDHFHTELSLEGGQFDEIRADVDVTGPIGEGDRWSYRVIGAWQDAGSFLDYAHDNVHLASTSLQFEPSASTRYILRTTYQESSIRLHFAPALQLAGNGTGDLITRLENEGLKEPDVPRSRFYGMPWNHADIEAKFAQLEGEHDFANGWKLRMHAQYNDVKYGADAISVQGPFDQDGFAYYTYAYGHEDNDELYGAEVNLFGNVELFGRQHTLFFGVDYSRIKSTSRFASAYIDTGFDHSPLNFNVYHPDYSAVPPFESFDDYSYLLYDTANETTLFGATVQLIAHPVDRLSVIVGGRYSADSLVERGRSGTPGDVAGLDAIPFEKFSDNHFRKFVGQVGATWEITPEVNLYASYGETFDPKTDRVFVDADHPEGRLIPPQMGTNAEVGLKANLTRDLSMNLAIFDMQRTNISQTDRAHPLYSVALGTQRSRGIELGGQGRLTPEISVFASLAYLDAEYSQGDFKGLQPANAPRFGASLYGSYELLEGSAKGLGFGFGVVHKSGRKGFDSDWIPPVTTHPITFDFGDFTEVDARVFYGRGRWEMSLTGTNLFNEKYYSPSFDQLDYATHVNPPRAITGRVSYKF